MHVAVPEDDYLFDPHLPAPGAAMTPDSCFALAYRLALTGMGHVSPNPLVGCVITDDTYHLLGAGAHRCYGGDHAEVVAVKQVLATHGEECLRRSRFFVTLQPCAHHGKTPPCTDLILKYKPQQVYFGMQDPRVTDSNALTRAGIECRVYNYPELAWLDEVYFWHNRGPERNRPFVAAKIATALDGSFAAKTGDERLQVTNTRARQYGHFLRLRYDAIMVGAQTLELDNPTLNVRLPLESQGHHDLRARCRNPIKVVLGSARIFNHKPLLKVFSAEPHKTIAVVPENEVDRVAVTEGVKLLSLPTDAEGRFDPAILLEALYQQI